MNVQSDINGFNHIKKRKKYNQIIIKMETNFFMENIIQKNVTTDLVTGFSNARLVYIPLKILGDFY